MPCTIKYLQGDGRIKYRPHSTQLDYSLEKVKDIANNMGNKIKEKRLRAKEILSQKGAMKKSDKDELLSIIENMDRDMRDGIPFYTEQVKRNAERMVSEAMIDAEELVTNIHTKIGSKILNHPEIIQQLLLEDKK